MPRRRGGCNLFPRFCGTLYGSRHYPGQASQESRVGLLSGEFCWCQSVWSVICHENSNQICGDFIRLSVDGKPVARSNSAISSTEGRSKLSDHFTTSSSVIGGVPRCRPRILSNKKSPGAPTQRSSTPRALP